MITSVAVVVPVADEAELLPGCLRALRATCRDLDAAVPTRIVVVLDGCTDASADIADRVPGVETVRADARCVGTARRIGSAHALRDVARPDECWLAATDADSQVPRHWLRSMIGLADGGADLVLGTVAPLGDHLPPRAAAAYHSGYVPRDGHPHVHGANLGIRASAYLRLGGWPALATGEDHALVARAVSAGDVRIRSTGSVPVRTSTRLTGRAPYGYSSYLRGLVRATGVRDAHNARRQPAIWVPAARE